MMLTTFHLVVASFFFVAAARAQLQSEFLISVGRATGSPTKYLTRNGYLVSNPCSAHRFSINSAGNLLTLDPVNANQPYFGPAYAPGNAPFQCDQPKRNAPTYVVRSFSVDDSSNAVNLTLQGRQYDPTFNGVYYCGNLANEARRMVVVFKKTPNQGCRAQFPNNPTPVRLVAVAVGDVDGTAQCFPQSSPTSDVATSEVFSTTSDESPTTTSIFTVTSVSIITATSSNPCPSTCTDLLTNTICGSVPAMSIYGYCATDCATLCTETQALCSCPTKSSTAYTCACTPSPSVTPVFTNVI